MFDKKKDIAQVLTDDKNNVHRPTKGSSKVIIGEGVNIKGEITNAEEVQIDGTADIVIKTENINVGSKGKLNGSVEAKNADIWGKVDGDLKISNTLTIQELGHVSGKIEYSQLQIKLGGYITGELIKNDKKINKPSITEDENNKTELETPKSLLAASERKV